MDVDINTLLTSLGTWAASMIATVAVLRTEVKWLTSEIRELHRRIDRVEDRIERRQAEPCTPYTGPERRAT